MAEFCRTCYKKVLKGTEPERHLVLSKDLELCEGCGEQKPVVVRVRRPAWDGILHFLFTGRIRWR
jgi:hypothetical protein